ncbi:MAG: hypothetical protein JSW69_01295 [Deltaproteobacteria bacterium]|nr:MAG: hypothetical protein JSW69_01295 [Deltaproteobacteria bacterium]
MEGKVGGMRFAGGENDLTDDIEKIEIGGRTDVNLSNSAGEFAFQLF